MKARFAITGGLAVVTGAASGIGEATAISLAARGCDLALVDRNEAGLARTAEAVGSLSVRVSLHTLDMADADAVAALPSAVLAEHGRVSILVNNAGVALMGRFEEMTLADFQWVMDINLWGVVRATYAFLPALREQPAAQIVNISSIFGLIAPPGQTAYCASKFAVRGFSESLRHELKRSAIGVTVVHPGGVKTRIFEDSRIAQGMDEEALRGSRERAAKLLTLDARIAGELIAGAIERRAPRLLIGDDARRIAWIQRLMPVTYWDFIEKRGMKR